MNKSSYLINVKKEKSQKLILSEQCCWNGLLGWFVERNKSINIKDI